MKLLFYNRVMLTRASRDKIHNFWENISFSNSLKLVNISLYNIRGISNFHFKIALKLIGILQLFDQVRGFGNLKWSNQQMITSSFIFVNIGSFLFDSRVKVANNVGFAFLSKLFFLFIFIFLSLLLKVQALFWFFSVLFALPKKIILTLLLIIIFSFVYIFLFELFVISIGNRGFMFLHFLLWIRYCWNNFANIHRSENFPVEFDSWCEPWRDFLKPGY